MCRNIRTLYNYDPPSTVEDIQGAALQFVRKVSGSTKPSKENSEAFDLAVEQVAAVVQELMNSLSTSQPKRNRDEEIAKARQKNAQRFA